MITAFCVVAMMACFSVAAVVLLNEIIANAAARCVEEVRRPRFSVIRNI